MAETAVGASSRLHAIPETVWGTTPATPQMRVVPFISESMNSAIGIIENNSIRADRRYDTPGQGNVKPAGDVRVVWGANSHAWLLYRAIGGTMFTTGAGPFTHTFQESASPDLPSFTLEKGFDDIARYFQYPGSRINTLSFELRPEANIEGSIGIIAKNEVAAATALDTTPTNQAYIPLDNFSGTFLQGSVALANLTELTLNLTNNVTGTSVLFSQFYGAVLAARLRISGTFSIFFTNVTQYNIYRNFTETDFVIRMQDLAGNFFEFQMSNVRYGGATPQIGGEGPVFFQGEFAAYTDATLGKQLQVVIKNDVANITT